MESRKRWSSSDEEGETFERRPPPAEMKVSAVLAQPSRAIRVQDSQVSSRGGGGGGTVRCSNRVPPSGALLSQVLGHRVFCSSTRVQNRGKSPSVQSYTFETVPRSSNRSLLLLLLLIFFVFLFSLFSPLSLSLFPCERLFTD